MWRRVRGKTAWRLLRRVAGLGFCAREITTGFTPVELVNLLWGSRKRACRTTARDGSRIAPTWWMPCLRAWPARCGAATAARRSVGGPGGGPEGCLEGRQTVFDGFEVRGLTGMLDAFAAVVAAVDAERKGARSRPRLAERGGNLGRNRSGSLTPSRTTSWSGRRARRRTSGCRTGARSSLRTPRRGTQPWRGSSPRRRRPSS